MNDISRALKNNVGFNPFKLSLSTLHAWIRFFECILLLSYRLDVKIWQMRVKKDKNLFQTKKSTSATIHMATDKIVSRLF